MEFDQLIPYINASPRLPLIIGQQEGWIPTIIFLERYHKSSTPRMIDCRCFSNILFVFRFTFEFDKFKFIVIPEYMQRAIEPLSDTDLGTRRWQGDIGCEQLYEAGVECNSPIIIHVSGFFEAEDV